MLLSQRHLLRSPVEEASPGSSSATAAIEAAVARVAAAARLAAAAERVRGQPRAACTGDRERGPVELSPLTLENSRNVAADLLSSRPFLDTGASIP